MVVEIELIQRPDGYYIARAIDFPGVVIEAPSRDLALVEMRAALVARRKAGVELVHLDLDDAAEAQAPIWPRHAGAFPDDALYQEMLAEVEHQRRIVDQDAVG